MPRGPDNEAKIAKHIALLLSHYFVTGEAAPLRRSQANDWIDDLKEFHEAIVADSGRYWRQNETRRPTPADIRRLCLEVTFDKEGPAPIIGITLPSPAEEAARIRQRQEIGERMGHLVKAMRGEIRYDEIPKAQK